jgi:predicted DCC family thiol-disulfide oxidoreductase YuxK
VTPENSNYLIYDGECPFCTRYARLTRLRATVGSLRLIDARMASPEVAAAREQGYVLDEGMLLHLDGRDFHGAECLNRLALLSSQSSLFNKLNHVLLRSPAVSRWTYPMLRASRNFALWLMGRRRLGY